MSLLGGIVGGVLGIGSSAVSGAYNIKQQKLANEANKELAQQQNEYNLALQDKEFQYNTAASETEYLRNLEQWNMQNEYNSPAAQIERYKAAGLNPNLIYGSGSASAGNVNSSPQFTAARYKAPHAERATVNPASLGNIDPYQAIQFGQSLAIQKAQENQINAQADFTKQETKNKQLDGLIRAEELTGRKLSNREREALFEPTVMNAHIRNRRDSNQADLLFTQNRSLQYDLDHLRPEQRDKLAREVEHLRINNDIDSFRLQLLRLGISDRDNAIIRFGSRLLLANEDRITNFIDKLLNR